jgi:TolB-like protein
MKKQTLQTPAYILTLVIFLLVFAGLPIRAAGQDVEEQAAKEETPSKILILPFTVHSDQELSFLKDSVYDMLSTRLSIKGKSELLSRSAADNALLSSEEVTETNQAISIGEKLKADYVVFGSLTVFGQSISTNARLADVNKKDTAVVFSKTGEKRGELISHVSLFADKIEEEIFADKKAESGSELGPSSEIEKSPSPQVAITPAPFSKFFSDWKSRTFDMEIRGLSLGDVDGDGKNETVFIDNRNVFVFRYMERKFKKIAEIEKDDSLRYLGVDVADINKNNKDEIFITAISPNSNRILSFVLEWDGEKLTRINEEINIFFRVLNDPAKKAPILVGQKQAMLRGLFSTKGVYEMEWVAHSDGGSYETTTRIKLPAKVNVYGFATGDVLSDGTENIVSYDRGGRILISDTKGSDIWLGDNTYGGSDVFIDIPDKSGASGEFERKYLNPRIHIADVDYDGINEVIAVSNEDFAGKVMARMRNYTNGRVDSMSWNNDNLQNEWTTGKITGYISDYVVGDIDNDGRNELIFSVVSKGGGFFSSKKSHIAARAVSN